MSDALTDLYEPLLELIRRTSTDLPRDIDEAMTAAREKEEPGSAGENVFNILLQNIEMSRAGTSPLCQDTGMISFYVHHPSGMSQLAFKRVAERAVAAATAENRLRPNSVDSLSGESVDDNLGAGMPVFHFEEWEMDEIDVHLLLKGGGCENVGAQFSLPDVGLGADRDLAGVKRCVLEAVHLAQGRGCAPGILGIGIGGDRMGSYELAKEQLLRSLTDTNQDRVLADFEDEMFERCNELGIGPMGFGGKTTLLGVKAGVRNRIPASYFVSVAYACWAHRHRRLVVSKGKTEII